jgi:biopolymer transport protein ExbD
VKIRTSRKRISGTALISMSDVVFLLIIFLLLSSNFATQTGLPIKLPASTSSQNQAPQVLHVVFENENTIHFMKGVYSLDTLEDALKEQFRSVDQVVRLSAQQDTELQSVIRVMDLIRAAGFEKIFIATRLPEKNNAR